MKSNSALRMIPVLMMSAVMITSFSASAQYCSPVFAYGCYSWNNQTITLNTLNWNLGSTSCSVWDYTTDTVLLFSGVSYPMTVTNGNWCGCGVWIDVNNDQVFDSSENQFNKYIANATNTYSFNISIPATVPPGYYRMRVIAGWGTDCYNVSSNGYGPCGSYQYGNFDDFTVGLDVYTARSENKGGISGSIRVVPHPAQDAVTVYVPFRNDMPAVMQLLDAAGHLVMEWPVTGEQETIGTGQLAGGIWLIRYVGRNGTQTVKFIK
jgi:hypothetical protein